MVGMLLQFTDVSGEVEFCQEFSRLQMVRK